MFLESLLSKTKMISLILVMLILVITFISFYFPMKNELETSYMTNFYNYSETKFTAVENFIERSVETTAGVTSRSAIRESMYAYRNDEINFEVMQSFVKPRYLEGLDHMSHLVDAQRIAGNQLVASHKGSDEALSFFRAGQMDIKMLFNLDPAILQVVSPIYEVDILVGYDVIRFDIGSYLSDLRDERIEIDVLTPEMAFQLQHQLNQITDFDHLYESDQEIYSLKHLPESSYVMSVQVPKKELFSTVESMMRISFMAFSLGIIGLFGGLIFIISRNAAQLVEKAESSRDRYKEKAYTDELTEVRTRLFLNRWIEDELKKFEEDGDRSHAFVMVDANRFKDINDEYGHIVGDHVLKAMADAMQKCIRDDDIIVRYGGDEFLLILKETRRAKAGIVMERIKEELKKIEVIPDPVSFTYGIAEVKTKDELKSAIQEADQKMYEMKRKKADQNNR